PESIWTTWRTPSTPFAWVASNCFTLPPNTGQRATVATSMPGTLMSMPYTAEGRSEEHTSELQSRFDLVCRLLLEKKKKNKYQRISPHKKNKIHQNLSK